MTWVATQQALFLGPELDYCIFQCAASQNKDLTAIH